MHVAMHVAVLVAMSVGVSPRSAGAEPERAALVGLEVRPGYAVRFARPSVGLHHGDLAYRVVADPLVLADGIHDLDLLVGSRVSERGYWVVGGWRSSAISVDGGVHWQQSLVVSASGELPDIGPLRVSAGAELAVRVVQHGGGLPREWIGGGDSIALSEALGFSVLLRVEYAAAF